MTSRISARRGLFAAVAAAIIAVGVFGQFAGPAAFAQTKPQITKDRDFQGNDVTTKKWEEDGKQHSESTHVNKAGKVTKKETEVIGPDGTISEIFYYKGDGSDTPTGRWQETKDNNGKVTEVINEEYNNGLLVGGDISVPDPKTNRLIKIKKWSNLHQKYDEVSKEDQDKERAAWKKYDDYMQGKGSPPWQSKENSLFHFAPGKINYGTSGTGETIGHVGDIKLQNLTDQPLEVYLPPTVLESRRGRQDYLVPEGQDVALAAHETKTVPLDGTCLERDKPPAGKGDHDLIYDDVGEPTEGSHFAPVDVVMLVEMGRSVYDAVDQLAKDGAYDQFPYSDKQEQENIATQWTTWSDPRLSDITGSPPANKDDFKKTVDKQVAKHGKPDKETRKKIDQGIDSMWDGIELTTKKAKDLEETEEPEGEGTPPPMPPGTFTVGNDTPTPAPQTTEKPKATPKGGDKTQEKPNGSPGKNEKVPMTQTRLLVNVLKGVDAHDKDDVTRPAKGSIKKDLAKAVKDANKLLSNCGVQLELAGADIVFDAPNPDTPGSENMGGNYDGDKAKDINKKAGEELKKAHGKPTAGFKIYIVTEITNKSGSEQGVGYWFPEEGPGFCILEASVIKDGRLLAHELGHGLGSLPDDTTKGNLMNPSPGVSDKNNLTDDQCKKLQNGAKQRE